MYKILTIDGGGIKGVFSIQLIHRLFEKEKKLKNIDLISGTSVGSILAAAIAAGLSTSDAISLFKDNIEKIFDDSYWDDIKDLGKLIGADYDYTNLKKVLKKYFGTKTLGDLKTNILIPTFDLDNEDSSTRCWKPKFYNTFQDAEASIVDVLIKSSVAPTYFPVYQGFSDGGLVANNPTICAIVQALDTKTVGKKLEEIVLLSVGGGFCPAYISGNRLDWGVSQWAPFLIPIFFDGMKFINEYQASKLLNERFFRLDPVISDKIDLDDTSKVISLIEKANEINLTDALSWAEKYWK